MKRSAGTRFSFEDLPAGVALLGPPGSNDLRRGNLVFRCSGPAGDAILKVYRRRGSALGERLAGFSQHWVEGKRGVNAEQRRATEMAALAAWRRHGCEVPRVLDRDPPDWIPDRTVLWMEFVEGGTLRDALGDPQRGAAARVELVARFADACARRHRQAIDEGETLLVQEHPATQHVLVSGERLVHFDLEHAYQPGFPMMKALAYELSSTVRSLSAIDRAGAYFDAFVAGYGEPEILRESCRTFFGSSLGWRIYRRHEAARRGARSKTEAMGRLADALGVAVPTR